MDLSVNALVDFRVQCVKMMSTSVLVFRRACMVVLVLTDTVATCASVEGIGTGKTVRSVALGAVRAALDSTLRAVVVSKALYSPKEDVVSPYP